LKQVTAIVISSEQVLSGLKRRRNVSRPRDISGSSLIWLRCTDIAREARPGQFVMVRCGADCMLSRPFSIHRVNGDDIALFFAAWDDGKGTNWLSQRVAGDAIELIGPLGNGFSIHPSAKNLLLVAGGIGIAPLLFLYEHAQNRGYRVKLLHGVSGEFNVEDQPNPPQSYPVSLLPRGIDMETVISSPDGKTGLVLDLLPEYVDLSDQIFACGPMAMYRNMSLRKRELGLEGKPVQVSLELRMGCGFGVCNSCTIKTKHGLKQVCRDGPVFELDDILPGEIKDC